MKVKIIRAIILGLCAPLVFTSALATAKSETAMSTCEGLDANGDHMITKDEAKKSADVSTYLSKSSVGNITVGECEDYLDKANADKTSSQKSN